MYRVMRVEYVFDAGTWATWVVQADGLLRKFAGYEKSMRVVPAEFERMSKKLASQAKSGEAHLAGPRGNEVRGLISKLRAASQRAL